MQQIGQLISNFATDQSEQVENALTGFSSESQTALLEVGTASELVQKSAANSQRRLKVAHLHIFKRFAESSLLPMHCSTCTLPLLHSCFSC